MMLRSHVEVAGFWRMVRSLFGDVVTFGMIWEFPIASKGFTQDWIEGFLHSSMDILVTIGDIGKGLCLRRLDMPST